jgi:hypothetical protein
MEQARPQGLKEILDTIDNWEVISNSSARISNGNEECKETCEMTIEGILPTKPVRIRIKRSYENRYSISEKKRRQEHVYILTTDSEEIPMISYVEVNVWRRGETSSLIRGVDEIAELLFWKYLRKAS